MTTLSSIGLWSSARRRLRIETIISPAAWPRREQRLNCERKTIRGGSVSSIGGSEGRNNFPRTEDYHREGCARALRGGRLVFGRSVQHFPHFARQGGRRKGLLQKRTIPCQHALMHNSLAGIAGHEQHLHLRAQAGHARGQLTPADLRHDDISNHQLDGTSMFFAN